jgi:hypothetical protein
MTTLEACISFGLRLTHFRLLEHQRNRHHNVVRDGKADLKVRTERQLHAQEHVSKNGRKLSIGASLSCC